MLKKFERITVVNDGSKRLFSLEPIFINTNKIISLLDTDSLSETLKEEGSQLCEKDFSILTWSHGNTTRESIVIGSAESISQTLLAKSSSQRELLNG